MILLLKAQIRGGAAGDLFAMPTPVSGHVRGATYVAPYVASRPHSAPAAPSADLLTVDDATYHRAVYDAAMARLRAGGRFALSTHLRTTWFDHPKHADGLRLTAGGIESRQGRGWVAVAHGVLDGLAKQLGLPTAYERLKHRTDTAPVEAAEEREGKAAQLRPLIAARVATQNAYLSSLTIEAEQAADAAYRALKAEAKQLGVGSFDLDDMVADYEEAVAAPGMAKAVLVFA